MKTFRIFVEITRLEVHDIVGKNEEDALEKIQEMFKDDLKAIKKIETIQPSKSKPKIKVDPLEHGQPELFIINNDNVAVPTDLSSDFFGDDLVEVFDFEEDEDLNAFGKDKDHGDL